MNGRILLVDDEESVLVTMQAILEMDGYSVATASQGAEVMEHLDREEFDLVLTDLRLEDIDGLRILAEVRRLWPNTVAIMLTGYASLESAVQALREGAYDYLVKPCDVDELRARVARGLERRQLGLQLEARVRELEAANATIRWLNTDLQLRIDDATAELRERMGELARARDENARLLAETEQHVVQLKELDELKSRFLSMASHELKTPLTTISGVSQLVVRRLSQRLEAARREAVNWDNEAQAVLRYLELLREQTGRLARLVDELLDVSRIESGTVEFHLAPVDLHELASTVAAQMQLSTSVHRISVGAEPGRPATVVGDRDHLEQVLGNLLSNAIKYSPRGGAITVEIHPTDQDVVLSVQDCGVGIPPQEHDAVFGLFYRSSDHEGRQVRGMGLGLYISKEIVTRHGGRIWVESELGQGSTFFMALPRTPNSSLPA